MLTTLAIIAAVFAISFVLTMVGLGGGLVFSPMFVLIGFAKADAASASLFLNLVAAASAAFVYARKRMVDYSLALPLILSSAATAPVGSYLNAHVNTRVFVTVMAVILLAAACRMLLSPPPAEEVEAGVSQGKKLAGGLGIGTVIGLIGGMLGIGGGVFVVPLLVYVLRTPVKIAAASSTFIVCFASLTGFIGYAAMGDIDWGFILPAAAACFVGGQAGSRFMSAKMKGQGIRIIFAILLVFMSLKLLQRAFF
jgi:hypothetical protein